MLNNDKELQLEIYNFRYMLITVESQHLSTFVNIRVLV